MLAPVGLQLRVVLVGKTGPPQDQPRSRHVTHVFVFLADLVILTQKFNARSVDPPVRSPDVTDSR